VNRDLAQTVRERAGERCEYCRIPQLALPLRFQIDHIIAEQHGGETVLGNLAFACPHHNRYKGPNIAGFVSQRSANCAPWLECCRRLTAVSRFFDRFSDQLLAPKASYFR
jgi:hypothetical protein